MNTRYGFLREDLARFKEEVERAQKKLEEAQQTVGQSDPSAWHDNFAYDQAQREAEMAARQLGELISIMNNAEVVEPYPKKDRVFIGRTVTLLDLDSRVKVTYRIGSFWVFHDDVEGPEVISYNAPLARIILGAECYETREGNVGETKRKFLIMEIR